MELWLVIVVGIACIFAGGLLGIFFNHYATKRVGTLIIDKDNPEVHGGVYTVFDIDPLTFHNKQDVCLDVLVVDLKKESQQNQVS